MAVKLVAFVVAALLVGVHCQDEEISGDGPQIATVQREFGIAACAKHNDDGTITEIEYDTCTSFCCGGEIVNNATGQECCGSIQFGQPYNSRYEHCCEWWTGHGRRHAKTPQNFYSIGCCGTERINWGAQGCCYGHPDPPQVFDWSRDLCCNAHRVPFPPNTRRENAACCGDENAYDRRRQSCPCENGQVIDVPNSRAACCETPDGLKTPYAPSTQICCNGNVAEIDVQFCCGDDGTIGTIGDNVCCDSQLYSVDPPDINKTACCGSKPDPLPYDPNLDVCCNNEVFAIIEDADQCCEETPYNPLKSICCDGNLWSTETEGTECCSQFAFFPDKGSFCCNGDVFLTSDVGGNACCGVGDETDYYFKEDRDFICCGGLLSFLTGDQSECCGTQPYSTETSMCCDDQVFDKSQGTDCCRGNPYFKRDSGSERTICCDNGPAGPFRNPSCCGGNGYDIEGGTLCCGGEVYGKFSWPACCVDVGYDARTHSCCGATVRPNPNRSTQVSCCGETPYDRNTQMCCGGFFNVTIPTGVPPNRAQCCDDQVYDTRDQLCCDGIMYDKADRLTSKCCGVEMYNTTEEICCERPDRTFFLSSLEFGPENTACCDGIVYNKETDYCCDGILDKKPFENTECCAGRPYNRMESICCLFELRPIGSIVPWQRAECCGDKCMYRGPQRCCHDRIYDARNRRTEETCEDF
ncbi:uncharacterized protein LOC143460365 [Clavelina lepadiformis]|uniref:Galaxin-like repeats domain-containing protein n=1 Tax=Clavelina lepadiformis TaxID=159417 RepID=A0ABP0GF70_CLALP